MKNQPKRIAIFHQFLDNIGGAEILTLTLAKELNANIYTTNILRYYLVYVSDTVIIFRKQKIFYKKVF